MFLFLLFGGISQKSLPHTRGGVSRQAWRLARACGSSPHTWGCFAFKTFPERRSLVFPTHVGVFPDMDSPFGLGHSLPHTRGGVSDYRGQKRRAAPSSPHTWGCFHPHPSQRGRVGVFPTHVGVFLSDVLSGCYIICLPHTRGGVSGSKSLKGGER